MDGYDCKDEDEILRMKFSIEIILVKNKSVWKVLHCFVLNIYFKNKGITFIIL